MSIFDFFTPTVSGQAAADLWYVNAGTDKRLGGALGKALGEVTLVDEVER